MYPRYEKHHDCDLSLSVTDTPRQVKSGTAWMAGIVTLTCVRCGTGRDAL